MAFQKRFGSLRWKRHDEAVIRVRQIDRQVVGLPLLTADDHQRLAEVGLCRPRRVHQRNKHLSVAQRRGTHVVLHDRVAAGKPLLHPQAIKYPFGGMPLFGWSALVFFQNRVDHAYPRPQLWPLRWLFPPVARRNRITQHLAHGHAGQSKLSRYRPLTSALD